VADIMEAAQVLEGRVVGAAATIPL
jgi:hypothetical protein